VEACKPIETLCDAPFNDAVKIADWALDTFPAVTVIVATLEPAAKVTDCGTTSAAVLVDNAIVTPLAPAALDRVTVHVDVPPGARLVGEQDSRLTLGGATSDITVSELPLELAPASAAVITAV